MVLLASSAGSLRLTLEQFTAACELAPQSLRPEQDHGLRVTDQLYALSLLGFCSGVRQEWSRRIISDVIIGYFPTLAYGHKLSETVDTSSGNEVLLRVAG